MRLLFLDFIWYDRSDASPASHRPGRPFGPAPRGASPGLPGLDALDGRRTTRFTSAAPTAAGCALAGAPRASAATSCAGLRCGMGCAQAFAWCCAPVAGRPGLRACGTNLRSREGGQLVAALAPGARGFAPHRLTARWGGPALTATRCPSGTPSGLLRRRCGRYAGGSPQASALEAEGEAGACPHPPLRGSPIEKPETSSPSVDFPHATNDSWFMNHCAWPRTRQA